MRRARGCGAPTRDVDQRVMSINAAVGEDRDRRGARTPGVRHELGEQAGLDAGLPRSGIAPVMTRDGAVG